MDLTETNDLITDSDANISNKNNQSQSTQQVLSYSQAVARPHSTNEPRTSHIDNMVGSREDRIADLEVQGTSFYNKNHFPTFYQLNFPGIDITRELDILKVERDIIKQIGEVKTIKKHSRNSLLIEVKSANQIPKITQVKKIADNPVTTNLDPILSFTRGVVRSKAMTFMSEEERVRRLSEQGVTQIVRLKTRYSGEAQDSNTFLLTFKSSTLPALIRLNQWHCEVVETYWPSPMRCSGRCQKLGHTRNQCRNEKETCGRCAQEGHSERGCANTPKCVNCGEDHQSSSGTCPHYQMRKEILKLQSTEKIPFREAKAKVRVEYARLNKRYIFEYFKAAPEPSSSKNPDDGEELPLNVLINTTDSSNNPPVDTNAQSSEKPKCPDTVSQKLNIEKSDNINKDTNNNPKISTKNQTRQDNQAKETTTRPSLDLPGKGVLEEGWKRVGRGGEVERGDRDGGERLAVGAGKLGDAGDGRKSRKSKVKADPKSIRSESLSKLPGAFSALAQYGDMDEEITRSKRPRHPSDDFSKSSKKPTWLKPLSKIEVLTKPRHE